LELPKSPVLPKIAKIEDRTAIITSNFLIPLFLLSSVFQRFFAFGQMLKYSVLSGSSSDLV
jgi:hypothetical protein